MLSLWSHHFKPSFQNPLFLLLSLQGLESCLKGPDYCNSQVLIEATVIALTKLQPLLSKVRCHRTLTSSKFPVCRTTWEMHIQNWIPPLQSHVFFSQQLQNFLLYDYDAAGTLKCNVMHVLTTQTLVQIVRDRLFAVAELWSEFFVFF